MRVLLLVLLVVGGCSTGPKAPVIPFCGTCVVMPEVTRYEQAFVSSEGKPPSAVLHFAPEPGFFLYMIPAEVTLVGDDQVTRQAYQRKGEKHFAFTDLPPGKYQVIASYGKPKALEVRPETKTIWHGRTAQLGSGGKPCIVGLPAMPVPGRSTIEPTMTTSTTTLTGERLNRFWTGTR